MKKKFIITTLAILIFASGIDVFAKNITKSQMRDIQTRIYDYNERSKVILAVANTLQDSDFIIEELETELGFLRAKKEYKEQYINKGRLAGQSALLAMATSYAVFTWGSTAAYTYTPARKITDELHSKNAVVDINVNIEQFGQKTKVRMVAAKKILQNAEGFSYTKNAPLKAYIITDEEVYSEFFNQLDQKLNEHGD